MKKTPARPEGGDDAGYFSSMFHEMPGDVQTRAAWSTRAVEVDARALDPKEGAALFARLWADDKQLVALTGDELQRLCRYCEFVSVPAGKEVIAQDERGNYMLVVLEGSLSVDRVHPWGAPASSNDISPSISPACASARRARAPQGCTRSTDRLPSSTTSM